MFAGKNQFETAPQLAIAKLSERLPDYPDIASQVGRVALPCGVEYCQPGICERDVNVCATEIALETSVLLINHQKNTISELEEKGRHDKKLTKLLDAEGLKNGFKELQANRKPEDRLALLFLDLDHFSAINESLGHQGGDVVLHEYARKLENTVRSSQDNTDIVGRWGGEEFVLVVNVDGATDEEFIRFAERINRPLRMRDDPNEVYTSSLGIVFVEPEDDYDSCVKKADTAMYFVKRNGRNNAALWQANGKPKLLFSHHDEA